MKPKQEQEKSARAELEEDIEHLPVVEHVLRTLTKLIHGRKLYADNNPRLEEFAREFDNSLRAFFRHEDRLVLSIDQYAILWRGQCVYENQKRDESIAFLLHRDGVGEITVGDEAVGTETDRFVRILTEEYHNLGADEDVVTKFWNADFEHISYRVLDDYLSVEYGESRSVEGDNVPDPKAIDHPELLPSLEDTGRVIVQRQDALESIDAYLKNLILHTCPASEEVERETNFQSMVGSFFTVNSEEISQCQQELEREKQTDSLAAFVEQTFVFTLLQDNPSAVRDVSGVVERIVDFAAADLNPHTLQRLLKLMKEFQGKQPKQDGVDKLCDRLVAKVTDETVIQSLGEKLKFWNKDSEEILSYFAAVGEAVIDPLLKVLHNVDGDKLHREICDVLVTIAGNEALDVIEKLDVDKPAVAYDAVYIANRVGATRLTPKLQELLFYPDVNVKQQIIELIVRVDDPSATDLLLGAFSDENKVIRLHALETVAAKNDPRVLQRIVEIAFEKELAERDPDEQEAVFKVLGRLGNASTVEDLKRFLEKKSFIQFGRGRENKLLAIRALECIKSPAALSMLKKLTSDSNDLVQAQAQRAYETLSAAMREGRSKQVTWSEDA